MLSRANHIVQRVFLRNFLPIGTGILVDGNPNMIITEYAKRADLHALINKVGRRFYREREPRRRPTRAAARNSYVVADADERIPKVVVWQIFDCCESEAVFLCYLLCAISLSHLSLLYGEKTGAESIIDVLNPSGHGKQLLDMVVTALTKIRHLCPVSRSSYQVML